MIEDNEPDWEHLKDEDLDKLIEEASKEPQKPYVLTENDKDMLRRMKISPE